MAIKQEKFNVEADNVHDCLDKAFLKLRSYFIRYNPAGYGTSAELKPTAKGLEVTVTRYAGCD